MNEAHKEHGIKVQVRYIGNPEPFEHQYSFTTTILTIKQDAMAKFQVDATAEKYALQYEQTVLNDSTTLEQAGFTPDHTRYDLHLVASENTDTDGADIDA